LLERLAILFPGHLIAADDLPARYRGNPTPSWTGGNMRIVARNEAIARSETSARSESAAGGESDLGVAAGESADRGLDFDQDKMLPSGGIDLKDHLNAIELGLIRQALEEADGTVAEAARLLRMRRTTLVEKLRKYRLSA
jgi:sigma-54 specific flagellar transcriptional regulator A